METNRQRKWSMSLIRHASRKPRNLMKSRGRTKILAERSEILNSTAMSSENAREFLKLSWRKRQTTRRRQESSFRVSRRAYMRTRLTERSWSSRWANQGRSWQTCRRCKRWHSKIVKRCRLTSIPLLRRHHNFWTRPWACSTSRSQEVEALARWVNCKAHKNSNPQGRRRQLRRLLNAPNTRQFNNESIM